MQAGTGFTWTLGIAIWGAIISTVAIAWNIYREFATKPKVRVDVSTGLFQVNVTATNLRSRPVTITAWGYEREDKVDGHTLKGTTTFPSLTVPTMLKESEQVTFSYEVHYVLVPFARRIFVEDSSGKKWYANRKPSEILKSHKTLYDKSSA